MLGSWGEEKKVTMPSVVLRRLAGVSYIQPRDCPLNPDWGTTRAVGMASASPDKQAIPEKLTLMVLARRATGRL